MSVSLNNVNSTLNNVNSTLNSVNAENDAHRTNTSNPHNVTVSQVGSSAGYPTSTTLVIQSSGTQNWSYNVSNWSTTARLGIFTGVSNEGPYPAQTFYVYPNSARSNGWQVLWNQSDKAQLIAAQFFAPVVNGICYGTVTDGSGGGSWSIYFAGWI